ncbi:MAG: ABC transporter substrate-binding protein [Minisyncoccota bacterium]
MDNKQTDTPLQKRWTIPHSNKILTIVKSFSITEKVLFSLVTFIFIFSSIMLLYQLNKTFLVEVPDYGGSTTEGIVGSPRFINPILAISDADRDLTSLIYSGLMKSKPEGGLQLDIAESYQISDDNLTYTFTLKDDAVFHDGTKITTDDIEFTIQKAQDSVLKSPRRSSWDGVTIEKIDEKTIRFILKQPYSPFIQNTTIGILPKHIWKNVDNDSFPFSTFNTKPVGSGPYKIDSIITNNSGLPVEYKLSSFKKYSLGRPFIDSIILKFYTNEKNLLDAFQKGDIESVNSISPQNVDALKKDGVSIITPPLPRVFAVFFNQNESPVFINKEVRTALDMVLNKEQMIDEVLFGYGHAIDGPIHTQEAEPIEITPEEQIQQARSLLEKAGWSFGDSGVYQKKTGKDTETLSFSISTSDSPELKAFAQIIQKRWQQLGARVDIKIFEVGDLNQNIIRPRKYDALLFGEVLGKDLDLYPFWHSSQRIDPGLNIALYTNTKTDKILEEYRKTTDEAAKEKYLEDFTEEINKDTPAVFLYSPYFIYITPSKIKNIIIGQPTVSGERFLNINEWYINTNNVWKFFIKN